VNAAMRWFAPASVGLALAAALLLPGRPVGLGLAVLGLALVIAVVALAPPRDPWRLAAWMLAAALAGLAVVRSAAWVVVITQLAAIVMASLAAAAPRSWRELGAASAAWLRHFVPGPLLVLGVLARRIGTRGAGRLVPAARGVLLAAVLLAVFVPLFVAADAAFAAIVDNALDLQVDHPAERIVVLVTVIALMGSLVLTLSHARPAAARPPRARLGATEWLIALGTLDALFAAFVALQLTTLFGGHDHVLRTVGLTYAEYARQGFGQLMVAAALTLGVVVGAERWARRDTPAERRALHALLGLLCLLTLALLASALKRLGLYEQAFGYTRLRLVAHAQLLWLGGLFVLVLVAGATRHARWLPRATAAVSAAAVLAFGLSDPDARIAQRNVARYERSGQIDLHYLARLSPDATPALVRLAPHKAACATRRIRATLVRPDGAAGFSFARRRARAALQGLRVPPGQLVCDDRG
jgi:hypothetical protein